jgi:hypothetical protein
MPRDLGDYVKSKNSNRGQKGTKISPSEQKLNKQLASYQIGLKEKLQASPFSSINEDEDFSGTGSQQRGRRYRIKTPSSDQQEQLDQLLNDRFELETIKQD